MVVFHSRLSSGIRGQPSRAVSASATGDSWRAGRRCKLALLTNVPHVSDIAFVNTLLLNTRELSKDTAKVLRNLPKSGPRVITRGSEPVGILIPPSPGGIEADIELLGRLRLGQALAATQREAVLNNTATLSMTDIDAEIRAARSARRIKANATTSLGH